MTPIIKWLVTAVILPIIQKMVGTWLKAREKAAALKRVIKSNQVKTEQYEKDPSSDDSFDKLP